MKMLGLTCGTRMGNSEILLKEALMEAEKVGAEVEYLRLTDFDLKPCLPCPLGKCGAWQGIEGCIYKDDGPFLYNKVMDCDALIISTPVWTKTPPGHLRALGDRVLGPKGDVAFKIEQKKLIASGQMKPEEAGPIDERCFKNRVGGFISVGGATSLDWVNLSLPLLHTMTFSLQIGIVDQIQITGAAMPGSVLLQDRAMERAGQLGRNVALQMGRPFDEVEFKGDPGTCPVCHLDMIVMRKGYVECAICGIHGHIEMHNGTPKVVFPEEEQKKSVLELEGKKIHFYEIMDVAKATMSKMGEVPARLQKYRTFNPIVKAPKGQTEKSAG